MADQGETSTQDVNPILVEVLRGDAVESRHRGSVCVVAPDGHVKAAWGDISTPIFPRSAIKIFQALPLVESGACDASGFDEMALSMSCASHGGEVAHTDKVTTMLKGSGLSEADLECGTHWPLHTPSAYELARNGGAPSQLHNNCSGKHAGMLALAKKLGVPTKGYIKRTHPVQQSVMGMIEFMTGYDLGNTPVGFDGCSVPTWAIPLENIAYGFARIADPSDLPAERSAAILRLRNAVAKYPFMVAGTDRFCTGVMEVLGTKAFIKTGAEGVFCAAFPEYGLGVALKCEDGTTRGAEMMMSAVMRHIGVIDEGNEAKLAKFITPRLTNCNDMDVGSIRSAKDGIPF